MKFRFIGQYTNGHTSIFSNGVTFVGREPSETDDPEAMRRLSNNIEFEEVREITRSVVNDPNDFTPVAAPKRRGRKPKAAQ